MGTPAESLRALKNNNTGSMWNVGASSDDEADKHPSDSLDIIHELIS